MANKRIIDGVDVSGCIFHSLTTMGYAGYNYCKCFECVCECHNDCYYKQLKRKEEECNKLKQALDEIEKLISEEVIFWDEVDKMTTQILNIINKTKEK